MNIENITSLSGQLEKAGFANMSYPILKHACFKPLQFLLVQKVEKNSLDFCFTICIEKEKANDSYVVKYYDAVLQMKADFSSVQNQQIDIASLDKEMDAIDWKNAFDFHTIKNINLADKSAYTIELKIEQIVETLFNLEKMDDGKQVATTLKQKYWQHITGVESIVPINNSKVKNEVSQRFYCFEGQPTISVDEACRFLQNKLIEKQMQVKKKQEPEPEDSSSELAGVSSNGSLLKKKRIAKGRKVKSS
jgi:hypothetical protein